MPVIEIAVFMLADNLTKRLFSPSQFCFPVCSTQFLVSKND